MAPISTSTCYDSSISIYYPTATFSSQSCVARGHSSYFVSSLVLAKGSSHDGIRPQLFAAVYATVSAKECTSENENQGFANVHGGQQLSRPTYAPTRANDDEKCYEILIESGNGSPSMSVHCTSCSCSLHPFFPGPCHLILGSTSTVSSSLIANYQSMKNSCCVSSRYLNHYRQWVVAMRRAVVVSAYLRETLASSL